MRNRPAAHCIIQKDDRWWERRWEKTERKIAKKKYSKANPPQQHYSVTRDILSQNRLAWRRRRSGREAVKRLKRREEKGRVRERHWQREKKRHDKIYDRAMNRSVVDFRWCWSRSPSICPCTVFCIFSFLVSGLYRSASLRAIKRTPPYRLD